MWRDWIPLKNIPWYSPIWNKWRPISVFFRSLVFMPTESIDHIFVSSQQSIMIARLLASCSIPGVFWDQWCDAEGHALCKKGTIGYCLGYPGELIFTQFKSFIYSNSAFPLSVEQCRYGISKRYITGPYHSECKRRARTHYIVKIKITQFSFWTRTSSCSPKILAMRIMRLNPKLVHPDQVGFIPTREAHDNMIKAINLIYTAHVQKIPMLLQMPKRHSIGWIWSLEETLKTYWAGPTNDELDPCHLFVTFCEGEWSPLLLLWDHK